MEFKQLISDFSMRHGVEHVDPEDDTVAFNVDGIPVLIAADEDEVAMISEIGEPPVEGRADFADLLLATNFNEKGAVFGKSQTAPKTAPFSLKFVARRAPSSASRRIAASMS